ncbi:MAG TPA: M1 family aminopeptidase, partial [Chitinophagaceae bacterium]|nr:M1 family aminopeptidase [Chitinophagaceae bacterium]
NWFYGILGSNEREYPWMDEGVNTFYEDKYFAGKDPWLNNENESDFQAKVVEKADQPINTPAEKFSVENYDLVAYYKTGEWLRYVESQLDSQSFRKAMQDYYQHWQFRHPQPEDFKNSISESTGKNVDSLFSYLDKKGILPSQERASGTDFIPALTGDVLMHPFRPSQHYFLFCPYGFGYNLYDGFKVGAILTNIRTAQPVPSKFEWVLVPQYAFGSKKFVGTGLARYNFFLDGFFRKITVGINGSTFSMDKYTDEKGNKTLFQVRKVVPNFRLTLNQKNPRSTLTRYIQFKTFLFGEDGLHFYADTVRNPPAPDTVVYKYNKTKENRTLNQLLLVAENYRALYPYRGELKIEQAKEFVRLAFTGNYFFNYPKGSGLDLRLFAGKFFYLGSKTFTKQFNTDRYHLNMTGANGAEDYTYSDYFIGRNEFEGAASQQIMVRDGAFKVRTDLLAEKVGKTDDWLIAMNLATGLPGLNPFKSLPETFPFKLKVFADVGTYAEPWKKNSTADKFLFDAGFQLSVLKTLNIYFPLVYSKVFKDYIQSTLPKKNRFLKVMSFSIDISNFKWRRLGKTYEY